MDDADKVTLAVLAGGEGQRMGRPKGKLRIDGLPILQWLISQINWPGPTLLVTAPGREKPPGCEAFHSEVVDAQSGDGPLRGILTALEHAKTSRVIFMTIDMPLVNREMLKWFVARSADGCVMGSRNDNGEALLEPFPLLIHRQQHAAISDAFADGLRAVRKLATLPGFVVQPTPPDWPGRVWINLNRVEDLADFSAAAGVSANF